MTTPPHGPAPSPADGDFFPLPVEAQHESPRHGFQGDRAEQPASPRVPAALSLAISRESGARGGTIARRVARRLGWQVYDQELLEFMAQESVIQQDGVFDALPRPEREWAEARLDQLLREESLSQHPGLVNLARVVLSLGAQGQVILIGRGAGYILPRASTLHARIVAPLADRVAYMSQWLRLTVEEAAERVRLRDQRRDEFIQAHFHCSPNDVHSFDLVLNSSWLGEDVCAELLVRAAQARGEDIPGKHGEARASGVVE
jgi:cytidylate kinase